jgi:hypothetical protein
MNAAECRRRESTVNPPTERRINSQKIARLHTLLHELRTMLYGEVLPLAAHLGCPDEGLIESLECAASATDQYLSNYRLEVVPVRKGGE